MDLFDIDKSSQVVVERFMDSNIYYIDTFYKNPKKLVEYLNEQPIEMHIQNDKPIHVTSFNGTHFMDQRHILTDVTELVPVTNYLQKLCNQEPLYEKDRVVTNRFTFFRTGFNDYENNYWFPHFDKGYTAIIYLSENDEECGTNIYENVANDDKDYYECYNPWRSKNKWKVIKTLKPKFNRCILFDGSKFRHGMNIIDQRYFNHQYRFNQTIFFKE